MDGLSSETGLLDLPDLDFRNLKQLHDPTGNDLTLVFAAEKDFSCFYSDYSQCNSQLDPECYPYSSNAVRRESILDCSPVSTVDSSITSVSPTWSSLDFDSRMDLTPDDITAELSPFVRHSPSLISVPQQICVRMADISPQRNPSLPPEATVEDNETAEESDQERLGLEMDTAGIPAHIPVILLPSPSHAGKSLSLSPLTSTLATSDTLNPSSISPSSTASERLQSRKRDIDTKGQLHQSSMCSSPVGLSQPRNLRISWSVPDQRTRAESQPCESVLGKQKRLAGSTPPLEFYDRTCDRLLQPNIEDDADSSEDEYFPANKRRFESRSAAASGPLLSVPKRHPSRRRPADRSRRKNCEVCDKSFTRRGDLERHKQTTSCGGGTKQMYRCHVCAFEMQRKDAMARHYTAKHPSISHDYEIVSKTIEFE